ncbi:RmlC-like cupin [Pseudovirgaria hyperparasitica]|uniref:RmlC-like cupin n=1 Tax=Pseudovirgaria hyperparasitica TaxID=470096 RepID=A0A6A6W5P2_9PEZI|nr:RmlC-like cupin [Pseudovirgaria hyperparasitica]KAF2756877.1 RmlC-like cupin [Pseudovirgaria hyperparasitica]
MPASLAKRTINPKTANGAYTQSQRDAQRAALILAGTEQARQSILLPSPPDATNITFQFINNTVAPPTGGTIFLSTLASFPALEGSSVAMAIGFMNPCALNTPHIHPRANEFLTVVQGSLIGSVMLERDSGFGNADAVLANYTGMLFPKGKVHWQFNNECEPAVFAAAFDDADPGRAEIAAQFFSGLPADTEFSATGNQLDTLSPEQISKLRDSIPSTFVTLSQDCAKRCGIPA